MKKIKKINASERQGFTLIEVLMAGSIMIILGASMLTLQYFMAANQITSINSFLSVDQANSSLNQMIREMRAMTPSENGSYPLLVTDDQSIEFYEDYDYDGDVEKIRYSIEGTNLIKGVVEPIGSPAVYDNSSETTRLITDNITNGTNALFTYFNRDWPADVANNPLDPSLRIANTRIIRITISVNTNNNRPNQAYNLESYVNIRTLKDNL